MRLDKWRVCHSHGDVTGMGSPVTYSVAQTWVAVDPSRHWMIPVLNPVIVMHCLTMTEAVEWSNPKHIGGSAWT